MKKSLLLSILSILFAQMLFAANGDTTKIRVHNKVDMTWYGNYNQTGSFPSAGTNYRKVQMTYTLGCPSSGCSHWDYTTQMFLRHKTGALDTVIQTASLFTVNGQSFDSLSFSTDTTFSTTLDSNNTVVNVPSTPFLIIIHGDSSQPFVATDTIEGWPVGMINPIYNANMDTVSFDTVMGNGFMVNAFMDVYSYPEHIDEYELGRVITPYASYMADGQLGFNNNWTHKYIFDVTDFQHLLRDSVELRAFYSGWSSGFSVTLDFDFIEGTPPRDILSVQKLYGGDATYSTSAQFESSFLPLKKVFIPQQASLIKSRITPTGHGFDNNVNAAEFSNRYYRLMVNGTQAVQQNMWRNDCGLNPIWPQNGTWVYDRANWCPGMRAFAYEHNITSSITPGDTNNIDMNVQSYTWNGTQSPSYTIQAYLISYGQTNFAADAELYDIISPSVADEYKRKNPRCSNPEVVIRNNGNQPLTSLRITYSVEGINSANYDWTGNLASGDTAHVMLPSLPWNEMLPSQQATFVATVSLPNGVADEYSDNNTFRSPFAMSERIAQNGFVVWLKTNTLADNRWFIYNETGDIVASRTVVDANKNYKDTLWLPNGCYRFELEDDGGDGIQWNYYAGQGSGFVRFSKKNQSGTLKTFTADFGAKIIYYFTLLDTITAIQSPPAPEEDWVVYPNPATTNVNVVYALPANDNATLQLFDLSGRLVIAKDISGGKSEFQLETTSLKTGIYFLEMQTKQKRFYQKIVISN